MNPRHNIVKLADYVRKSKCKCGTARFMEFECVLCCVRWLQQMTAAEMAINAPVIAAAVSQEHLNKVREAWRVAA